MTPGVSRRFVALDVPGRPQSHCSSPLVLADGTVLVAWFAGDHEGAGNVRVVLARGPVDAAYESEVLFEESGVCHWNPVLAAGPDDAVWLFFKRGPSIETWVTWVTRSHDRGATWSDPVELVPGDGSGGRGPVRHPPLSYRDSWVAPGSVERWGDPARWDCFVDVWRDGQWDRADVPLDHSIRGAGCIQPSLWVTRDGELAMLCRSTAGSAYRSVTRDPDFWPALLPTGLPNNNSGLSVVALPSGRLVCAHNPGVEDWGARCPLVLSTSDDEGLTWDVGVVTVEDGSPFEGVPEDGVGGARGAASDGRPVTAAATGVVTSGAGEYSYPSIREVGDQLLVVYTWQRRGIVAATLPISLVEPARRPGAPVTAPRTHSTSSGTEARTGGRLDR